jgi:stage III sporulation protein AF
MINNISNWAGNIVAITVLITIIEMILPNNKNKKYVELVCGLLFVIVVMKPIFLFLNDEIDLGKLLLENEREFSSVEYNTQVKNIQESQNENILKVYEEKLKEDIATNVKKEGYEVSDLALVINKNNYGINEMSFKAYPSDQVIQTININIYNSNSKSISEIEKNKIKAVLNSIYNVQPESIHIY